jgi:hypothetical protein
MTPFMGIRPHLVKRLRCTRRARNPVCRAPAGRTQIARSSGRSTARRASILLHGRVSATPEIQIMRRASAPAGLQSATTLRRPGAIARSTAAPRLARRGSSAKYLDVMQHRVWCGRPAWCQARSSWRARCAAGRSLAQPSDSRRAAPTACDTPPASCRNGSSDAASAS